MSKIRIVNWLLTRRCNLKCDYCAIVRDYNLKPGSYLPLSHYIKNEMSTEFVLEGLKKLKDHNPNVFNIFYGGEPLLRKDLPEIINYCNENKIFYTIITNNTPEIQPLIKNLFDKTDYVEGFTSSVDPIFNEVGIKEDRIKKSIEGLQRLKEIQVRGDVKDVVAEITVMNQNKHLLHQLVSELSQNEIYSDITFVDIAKTNYYDFSNVHSLDQLVNPTFELACTLKDLMEDDSLLIHMKDLLIPKMFDTLPSDYRCNIEKSLHNITVDADGTLRLCLRIRGTIVPKVLTLLNLFNGEEIDSSVLSSYKYDKRRLCLGCNHSCLMMSQHIDELDSGEDDLVHIDKRETK